VLTLWDGPSSLAERVLRELELNMEDEERSSGFPMWIYIVIGLGLVWWLARRGRPAGSVATEPPPEFKEWIPVGS